MSPGAAGTCLVGSYNTLRAYTRLVAPVRFTVLLGYTRLAAPAQHLESTCRSVRRLHNADSDVVDLAEDLVHLKRAIVTSAYPASPGRTKRVLRM